MRSSREGLGLALLRLDKALDGVQLTADQAVIVPVKPQWMRLDGSTEAAAKPEPGRSVGQ